MAAMSDERCSWCTTQRSACSDTTSNYPPFCEDEMAAARGSRSRVRPTSVFSPRVSSTSDPHARTFFVSRT
eukprot:2783381-Prymnesium_polylepis.1